jgi:hypothetical protein
MYKIFTDKGKLFKCNIDISGASMKDCHARLLLETDENIFLYKGKVNSNGVCEVEIPKIKNFEEGVEGKMKLEVIVENTLFNPWESDFIVTASKKVNVQVEDENDLEPVKESIVDNKMKVSVIMDDEDENLEYKNNLIKEEVKKEEVKEVVQEKKEEIKKEEIKKEIKKEETMIVKENKSPKDEIFDFNSFLENNK